MIEVVNKTSKGKTIIFTTQPVVGVVGLASYNETLTGVNSSEFFLTTTFRYSKNGGIDWSEPLILNSTTIASLNFNAKDIITFEVTFTKSTPSETLDVTNFELNTSDANPNYNEQYYKEHLVSRFFNSDDNQLVGWYMNVTKKLYEKGLLPNYIDRKYEDSNEHFLDFWNSITKFFSYYVLLSRKYGKFYEVDFLLDEYIKQRGLSTSKNNTLEELQSLMSTYYQQIGQRGTHMIHSFGDGKVQLTDGELLRLINYTPGDKFTFLLFEKQDFGWNLGNSSPLYRGIKPFTVTNDNSIYAVNPDCTYTFWSQMQVANLTDTIKVELIEYDSFNTTTPLVTTVILNNIRLQRINTPLPLKIHLYKAGTVISSQYSFISNFASDIVLNPLTRNFEVIVKLNGNVVAAPTIDNISIQPSYTDYSRCFIQTVNWIHIWLVNRNKQLSINQLKKFISYYLLPYNTHLELSELAIINSLIEKNLLLLQTGDKVKTQDNDFINLINS